jgi:YHS domain-containing protein
MSAKQDDPARMTLMAADGCSCCAGTPAVRRGGGTVTDPVCGMAVTPEETTPNATYNGQTYYFCAPGCRRAFERDPEAYTTAPAG